MRQLPPVIAVLLCMSAPAVAQVTVDLRALDALPKSEMAPPHRPPPRPAPKRVVTAKPATPHTTEVTALPTPPTPPAPTVAAVPAAPAPLAGPAPPAGPVPPAATLPTAPPPVVALAPLQIPPPEAQPAPPPPPPISDTSNTAATATTGGLRVTFTAGQSDLSPGSAAAIKNVVQSAPPGDMTSFNVVAYAAGTPDDPSTARRLSLSRALAVRSALMADGVSSTHIYVRALGAPEGDKTPDRVDISVLGANASAGGKSKTR